MIYPLTLFSTIFGMLKRCPHCGKFQMVKREQHRPVCRKCGRQVTVQLKKRKSV